MNSPLARYRWFALLFAMTYPTLLTWIYFTALKDSPGAWQQAAFGVVKFVQFAFPAFWVFVIERRQFVLTRPTTRGLGLALLLGIFEIAAGLALYFIWLKPGGVFAGPLQEMLLKLRGFGLDSRAGFVMLAVAYSLVHSWLEEYYWRWFVLRELSEVTNEQANSRRTRPLLISSLAFAAHHVIVLAGYFGWASPWTYLLSAFVAIGGGLFGWLYLHSKSIYAAWLAHAMADAVIFLIGWDLLAGLLS
jgi:membrane protease YdiL (CAAX protease family)